MSLRPVYQQLDADLQPIISAMRGTGFYVYNPLEYAWNAIQHYLALLQPCPVLLVGMNPGPYGMLQTGVPFGEIVSVRDYLRVRGEITQPPAATMHPKRPITGWGTTRQEVSGKRLWGLLQHHYPDSHTACAAIAVINYCPLGLFDAQGRNITPDKLPVDLRNPLENLCDKALQEVTRRLAIQTAIGVGGYAAKCLQRLQRNSAIAPSVTIGQILHPSPASPTANRGWEGQARQQLQALGVNLPTPR